MPENPLSLTVLKETFSLCRLDSRCPIPEWVIHSHWFSVTRTPDELSIACPGQFVPAEVDCEKDWKCIQVVGPLGFSLVGILSSLITPLADVNVSIFNISTFETDYIFVKEKDLEVALQTLSHLGHWISRAEG
jgi:hypothetical protein